MAERSTASTEQAPGARAHLRDFRRSLSRADRRSLIGMTSLIVVLHLVGFGLLLGVVAPQHFALGGDYPVYTVGVGILAYTFGLRHAFDADHIAAIDNTTRKLMTDGQRPVSVGFWFSLGHSTVVLLLCVLLAFGSGRWPGRSRTSRRRCSRPPG